MKNAYKFIAGNSMATPIGVAIAVVLTFALRGIPAAWQAAVYIAVLLFTLAASTFERVQ